MSGFSLEGAELADISNAAKIPSAFAEELVPFGAYCFGRLRVAELLLFADRLRDTS